MGRRLFFVFIGLGFLFVDCDMSQGAVGNKAVMAIAAAKVDFDAAYQDLLYATGDKKDYYNRALEAAKALAALGPEEYLPLARGIWKAVGDSATYYRRFRLDGVYDAVLCRDSNNNSQYDQYVAWFSSFYAVDKNDDVRSAWQVGVDWIPTAPGNPDYSGDLQFYRYRWNGANRLDRSPVNPVSSSVGLLYYRVDVDDLPASCPGP